MLEVHKQFTIKMVENKLLFSWKKVQLFSVNDYKYALNRIVFHCSQQTPTAIIIDKLLFQPNVILEPPWYNEHVLPTYHKIGIQYLAHVTGKVKESKILPISNKFHFKNIEFESLKEALDWSKDN